MGKPPLNCLLPQSLVIAWERLWKKQPTQKMFESLSLRAKLTPKLPRLYLFDLMLEITGNFSM